MNTSELFDNYWKTCFHYVYTSSALQYPPLNFVSLSQERKGQCCHCIDIASWSNPFDVPQPTRETLQGFSLVDVQNTWNTYQRSITTPNISKEPLFVDTDFCFFKNGERVSFKVNTVADSSFTGSIFIGTIPHPPLEDAEFPIIIKLAPDRCQMGTVLVDVKGAITIYADINKIPDTGFVGWKTTFITYFLC